MNYNDPVGATYEELRFAILKQLEGVAYNPYLDTHIPDRKVTIGIGFNIEDSAGNRNAVFDALGIGENETSVRQQLTTAINEATTKAGLNLH